MQEIGSYDDYASSRGQKRRTEIGQPIFPKMSEPFLRWRPSLRAGIRMFFGAHRRVSKWTTISGIRVLESSSSWMMPLVGYAAQVSSFTLSCAQPKAELALPR
jgi:hypothetical protein